MELHSKRVGNALVLNAQGRIDHAHADGFKTALDPSLAQCVRGGPGIVLDMSGVEYISSVGLRALMVAAKQIKSQGGRMVVAALAPVVREVFEISRFHLVFEIFDSVDAALAALGSSA
jgi:anti-sigma B factor antagonist/stage II sporulation protein AA (anti-sigma F factor antagonist)